METVHNLKGVRPAIVFKISCGVCDHVVSARFNKAYVQGTEVMFVCQRIAVNVRERQQL